MPYAITFEDEPPLIEIAFEGRVSGDEVMAAVRALRTHPGWSPALPQLWDGSALEGVALTPSDMRMFIQSADELPEQRTGRQALVARHVVHRSVALLYKHSVRHRQIEVEVFSDVAAARRWIGEGALEAARNPEADESLR